MTTHTEHMPDEIYARAESHGNDWCITPEFGVRYVRAGSVDDWRDIVTENCKLPFDVKIGNNTFGKGVTLKTVIDTANRYYGYAMECPSVSEVRSPLFRVRGAILAEIDTNPKEANRNYWTERLADLDEALSLLPQPPKEVK